MLSRLVTRSLTFFFFLVGREQEVETHEPFFRILWLSQNVTDGAATSFLWCCVSGRKGRGVREGSARLVRLLRPGLKILCCNERLAGLGNGLALEAAFFFSFSFFFLGSLNYQVQFMFSLS